MILSFIHLLSDCEKQSTVINVCSKALKNDVLWFEGTPDDVSSQEFQWGNALMILTFVCMVKIGHTFFYSKFGFPSDSYFHAHWTSHPLIHLTDISFLMHTSIWYVWFSYEIVWTHFLIMISVNFLIIQIFSTLYLEKKEAVIFLFKLLHLLSVFKSIALVKTIRRCHLLLKRFVIDEKNIYTYRKDRMNLHFNKDIFFQKIFYLQHHLLPCYSSCWSDSSWPTAECQTKKCSPHTEKLVKHSTFGPWPTTWHHAALWGHSKV